MDVLWNCTVQMFSEAVQCICLVELYSVDV